jgi:AcrR family transcriptional regulator
MPATQGAPPPRTKPADIRRQEILEAGERVILAKGIAKASVDDIVAAAGVAKGTFYLYFASKEALVHALRERWVESIHSRVADAEARVPRGDWAARLSTRIEAGTLAYFARLDLHDVLFHGDDFHPGADDPMSLSKNKVVADLTEFLRAGAAAGAWRVRDPRLLAVMMFHAFHGGLDYVVAQKEKRLDRKRLIADLDEFFRRALELAKRPAPVRN